MANVGIGAFHPQQVQHCGQQIGGVQYLVHFHWFQIRAPDEAGRPLQQQRLLHAAELQQGRCILVAVGIVIRNADDNGVFQLIVRLQLRQQPGEQIVHQPGF